MTRVASILVILLVGCREETPGREPRDPTTGDETTAEEPRTVVRAEQPLALDNPQQDVVTWPLWGGAFTLGEPVTVTLSLSSPGSSGIVLAGPGSQRDRASIALVAEGGGWTLKEALGPDPVQEVPLEGFEGAEVDLVLEIPADGSSLTVGDQVVALENPLGDGAAGLYVTLDIGATLEVHEVTVSQPVERDPALGTPLRELAAARGLFVGSATDIWPPLHDHGFESLFGQQFDAAAPTEFYWPTTRGEDQDWYFLPADLMVNYALVHDQRLTGMFLVWDFALPRWVQQYPETEGYQAFAELYDEHITTLVSRYRGKVDAWVVVNEAIWGPGEAGNSQARFAQTLWSDWLGVEHIERAFTVARAADPDAVLMYNETGAEALNEKSDFLYAMAQDLVGRGVPIDAIGLQFHVHAGSPPDLADVRANFERFAALGLEVYVTELDVSLEGLTLPEAEALELQAQLYVDVLEACLAVEGCESWTVFGFSDKYAWDELGDATPLMFDEDYAPKPAYFAVQAALAE